MASKRLFSKTVWQDAVGRERKCRRLNLKVSRDGAYICPVTECDSESFKSQRGCRKHVFTKHGWYYFFDKKPDINEIFPELLTRGNSILKEKRSVTSSMPSFVKTCDIALAFARWLKSPGGGGKSSAQAEQIMGKVMKYAKFCCEDVSCDWNIPEKVTDYCIGSVALISDFVEYLQNEWKVRPSGIIGYLNSLSHFLDFRRSHGVSNDNIAIFLTSEIYLQRSKKCLQKTMKSQWNEVLSIDCLNKINCWASIEDL